MLKTMIVSVALFMASLASAQSTQFTPYNGLSQSPERHIKMWAFSGVASMLSINEASAAEQGVKKDGLLISFIGDYYDNGWLTSIGFGSLFYEDERAFKQRTVDDRGREYDSESSAIGFLLSGASGYQWSFGSKRNTHLSLQGGYELFLESQRSIGSCSNCASEKIDLDAGVFSKFRLLHNVGNSAVGLQFVKYLSDDLDYSIGLLWSSRY